MERVDKNLNQEPKHTHSHSHSHIALSALGFISLFTNVNIVNYNHKCVSCIINSEFTAIFPAASSPARCVNPSAAEEAMTQEGTGICQICGSKLQLLHITSSCYQNVSYVAAFRSLLLPRSPPPLPPGVKYGVKNKSAAAVL